MDNQDTPESQVEQPEQPPAETPPDQDRLAAIKPLSTGQIVDGLIVHIDDQGALVDVGTKSEGHIPAGELGDARLPGSDSDASEPKPLSVGDRIAVYVVRPEDEDGSPVLSKKRADYEFIWQRIIHAFEEGEVLSAMVTDRVKGGLVVDLGLRGFLPASHVRTRNIHALDRFVGQSVKVKIIEVDRSRKRVVVSQKEAIEQQRRLRRERTLASLEENKVYRGIVRRITDYGAFVDLGGVDGLLHITEMSWTRINHPGDVVKVGDRIDVMVLRFDRDQNRISLGLKQILPDPWTEIESHYQVGQTVTGAVSRVVPFGIFVRLEGGIEGIVPNVELPGARGHRAAESAGIKVGDSLQVKIISIRPQERRMSLSLRQVQQARERRELKEYLARQEEDSRVTIGDLFGSVLAGTQAARQQQDQPAADPDQPPAQPAPPEEPPAQTQPPEPEPLDQAADQPSDTPAEQPPSAQDQQPPDAPEPDQCSSSESPAESEPEKD